MWVLQYIANIYSGSWLAHAGDTCLRLLYLSMFQNKGAPSLYFPLTVHKCVSRISHLKPPWVIHKLRSQWVLHRIWYTTCHTEAIVILHEGSRTSTAQTSQKHWTCFFFFFSFYPPRFVSLSHESLNARIKATEAPVLNWWTSSRIKWNG